MILLTGSTGTVGSEVTKQLIAAGYPFRMLARNPEKAAAIAGPSADIVQGEMTDRAALDKAMVGVGHLFLLTPSGPQQVGVEKGIVDAASDAGVDHIVKLSVLGASSFSAIKINQWHWYSEKYIEKLDIPFTAVRPGFFMQNTLMYASSIAQTGQFYSPLGDGRVSMIDARDIASVCVAALTQEGHVGKVYDLTGPEPVSLEEMSRCIGAAIGKDVKAVPVEISQARNAMLEANMPEWLVDDMMTYMEYFRAGAGEYVTPMVDRVKRSRAITYAQFARDYADAFAKGAGE